MSQTPPITDVHKGQVPAHGEMFMYYVMSDGTYFGTTKYHRTPDCTHLRNWQPAGYRKLRASGWKGPRMLYRTVLSVPVEPKKDPTLCKTCWRDRA